MELLKCISVFQHCRLLQDGGMGWGVQQVRGHALSFITHAHPKLIMAFDAAPVSFFLSPPLRRERPTLKRYEDVGISASESCCTVFKRPCCGMLTTHRQALRYDIFAQNFCISRFDIPVGFCHVWCDFPFL